MSNEMMTPEQTPTAKLPPPPPINERDVLANQLRALASAVKVGSSRADIARIQAFLASL